MVRSRPWAPASSDAKTAFTRTGLPRKFQELHLRVHLESKFRVTQFVSPSLLLYPLLPGYRTRREEHARPSSAMSSGPVIPRIGLVATRAILRFTRILSIKLLPIRSERLIIER